MSFIVVTIFDLTVVAPLALSILMSSIDRPSLRKPSTDL
jgi:hypothetical protein